MSCEPSVAKTPATMEMSVLVIKVDLGSATHIHLRDIQEAGL